jgi:hypothetical protein
MNCYAKLRNKIQDIRLNLPGTVRSNPAEDDRGRGLQLSKSIVSVKDRHPVIQGKGKNNRILHRCRINSSQTHNL